MGNTLLPPAIDWHRIHWMAHLMDHRCHLRMLMGYPPTWQHPLLHLLRSRHLGWQVPHRHPIRICRDNPTKRTLKASFHLAYPSTTAHRTRGGTFFSPLLNKENQQKNEVTPKFLSSCKDTKRTWLLYNTWLPKAYTNNLKIDIVDIDDRHRRCRLRGCGRGTTQVLKERKREGKGVGDVSWHRKHGNSL